MSEFDKLLEELRTWIIHNNNKTDVLYEVSDNHIALTIENGQWVSFTKRGNGVEVKSSNKYPMGIIFPNRTLEEVFRAI